MDRVEYIMIQISMILEDLLDKYNLKGKAQNVYIFTQVIKGVYVIPQAGRISHDSLLKHLELYGYGPLRKTLGLWKHNSWPINFTFLVDIFGGNKFGKISRPTPESSTRR